MTWQKWLLLSLGLVLVSCARKDNSDAAIRKAIEDHLAGRPGLMSAEIVMDLKKVDIKGDDAEANVVFHSRNAPNAAMDFQYQLHRDGQGWKVGEGHPSGAAMSHPQAGEGSSGGEPSDNGSGQLPPGHPSVP